MSNNSDYITLDFGDPIYEGTAMVLKIQLPKSYDPTLVSRLLDKASNLRDEFVTEFHEGPPITD